MPDAVWVIRHVWQPPELIDNLHDSMILSQQLSYSNSLTATRPHRRTAHRDSPLVMTSHERGLCEVGCAVILSAAGGQRSCWRTQRGHIIIISIIITQDYTADKAIGPGEL
jgi:hypothetical protein